MSNIHRQSADFSFQHSLENLLTQSKGISQSQPMECAQLA